MDEVPPPSYEQVIQAETPRPSTIQAYQYDYATFAPEETERFRDLVRRANTFLRNNPNLHVTTCETLTVKIPSCGHRYLCADKASFTVHGNMHYAKCLRLWYRPLGPDEEPGFQTIDYFDETPGEIENEEFMFERYDTLLARLNQRFSAGQLRAKRILSVETVDARLKRYEGFDAEKTTYAEPSGDLKFINFCRVFYERGDPSFDQIGCVDFVPVRLGSQGYFESFSDVMYKARQWIFKRPELNIINIQSVNYLFQKLGGADRPVDTHLTLYKDKATSKTSYVRVVRIYYKNTPRPPTNSGLAAQSLPITLRYKDFRPDASYEGDSQGYESLDTTWKKARGWIRSHTDMHIISSESVIISLAGNQRGDPEVTYMWTQREDNVEKYLTFLRVYYYGGSGISLDEVRVTPTNVAGYPQPRRQNSEDSFVADECCILL